MNKSNSGRSLNLNEADKNGMSFNILSHSINNIDENSFDLDMDSAEDEIDVGTHADSMLINYNTNNSNYNNLETHHQFPLNSSSTVQTFNTIVDHNQFSTLISNNNNQSQNNLESHCHQSTNFAVPQHTAIMSEADRKRAHHNALERKRRDHIKDSFHTLRDAIPNIKGEKVSTSRAQILKAATDYIKTMKNRNTIYQNDIDQIKKQNMEIEAQIRQLEKSKLNVNQTLGSSVLIKQEQIHPLTPTHMQLNDNVDDNDFKFDFNESMQQSIQSTNLMPPTNTNNGSNNFQNKPNNVLILTKTNGVVGQPTAAKKFKTIVTPKTSLVSNSTNLL